MTHDSTRTCLHELKGKRVHEVQIEKSKIPLYAMEKINEYLARKMGRILPSGFNTEWVASDGELRGKFTKRVAQYFSKSYGAKLLPSNLENLGNIARSSYPPDETVFVSFTDDLDWKDGDFGDPDSCYWSSNVYARWMLMHRKAFAVQFYIPVEVGDERPLFDVYATEIINGKAVFAYAPAWWKHRVERRIDEDKRVLGKIVEADDSYYCGVGRAWILPDVPRKGDAVVFNCYHYDNRYKRQHAALILAQSRGVEGIMNIDMDNFGEWENMFYINAGRASLVSSADRIRRKTSNHLKLRYSTNFEKCRCCDEIVYRHQTTYVQGYRWCKKCKRLHAVQCHVCKDVVKKDAMISTVKYNKHDWGWSSEFATLACPSCFRMNLVHKCLSCKSYATEENARGLIIWNNLPNYLSTPDTWFVCPQCADVSREEGRCVACDSLDNVNKLQLYVDGEALEHNVFCLCNGCLEKYAKNELGNNLFPYDFDACDDAYEFLHDRFREANAYRFVPPWVLDNLHKKFIAEVLRLNVSTAANSASTQYYPEPNESDQYQDPRPAQYTIGEDGLRQWWCASCRDYHYEPFPDGAA